MFGLACHIGILLDLPSVGVAKTLYHVDGIEKNEEHQQKVILPYIVLELHFPEHSGTEVTDKIKFVT